MSILASNVFLTGSSTAGNAFTVQQLGAGNVASFQTSTSSTSLIINPSGNVGIGKTNPGYALDVTGDINFTGTFRQNGTAYVGSQWTGTTSLYFVGNVGIGTTNPGYPLDVQYDASGTVNNTNILLNLKSGWDSGVGANTAIRITRGNYGGQIAGGPTSSIASQLIFSTLGGGGGDTMWLLNKNVGIGTNNPQYRLHVMKPGPLSNIIVETDTNAIGQRSEIRFGIPAFSGTAKRAGITSNTYVSDGSDLQFWTNASSGAASAPQMTILPTGNVGIGTNNPSSYTLQVTGSVGASTSFTRTTGSTGTAFAAPGTGLASTDYNYILSGANDTANRLVVFVNGSARTADGGVSNVTIRNDAGSLILGNPSFPTIVYGNVGIGTTDTTSRLYVYSATASPTTSLVSIGNSIGYGAGNGDQTVLSGLYTSLGNTNNIVQQIGKSNDTNSFFYGYQHNTGSPYFWIARYGYATTSFTVNANGVGIGTTHTNTAFKQSVYSGDASMTLYGPNGTWGAYLSVGAGNTYCGSGRASVTCSNGNLHIDNATGAYNIYLNYFQGGGSGGTNATVGCYAAFTATGDITAFSSDERLKTKVGLIENALDKVCSLTAFKYIHNETARQNGFKDDNVYVGLSAQEVQKVLPEVVKPAPFDQGTEYDVGKGKSKSGQNFLTIQYERIVSLLVEAVKEERAERLKVEERLARLEKLLLKE